MNSAFGWVGGGGGWEGVVYITPQRLRRGPSDQMTSSVRSDCSASQTNPIVTISGQLRSTRRILMLWPQSLCKTWKKGHDAVQVIDALVGSGESWAFSFKEWNHCFHTAFFWWCSLSLSFFYFFLMAFTANQGLSKLWPAGQQGPTEWFYAACL